MDPFTDRERKRQKFIQEAEDHLGNHIDSLPREVLIDIISRLPIKSLIQFRYVCKSWYALTHENDLLTLYQSKTEIDDDPCLILHSDLPIKNQLHFVEFSGENDEGVTRKFRIPFSDSMPEFNVVGSSNGLLCLSDSLYGDALYIYNPFTNDYKELPRTVEFQSQMVVFGFGFNPMNKDYKVVKVIYYANTYDLPPRRRIFRFQKSEVQVFSSSSNRWRSLGEAPHRLERRSNGIYLNGRLHWVSQRVIYRDIRNRRRLDKIMVSFDLGQDQWLEVPKPEFPSTGQSWHNYHLAVLQGCLAVAVHWPYNNSSLDIWIMREYGKKESWVKEFSVAADLPKYVPNQTWLKPYAIWRNVWFSKLVRVLCLLRNGEILLEYRGGNLVSYSPLSGEFKDLKFQGMPGLSRASVLFGSLNWIDTPPLGDTLVLGQ